MVALVAVERPQGLVALEQQVKVLQGAAALVVVVIRVVAEEAHPQLVGQEAELLLVMEVLVQHQAFLAQA
jgi:hypothetical protein